MRLDSNRLPKLVPAYSSKECRESGRSSKDVYEVLIGLSLIRGGQEEEEEKDFK
jgi:hypothetical protein